MELVAIKEQHLTDIATAIRGLNKSTKKYRVKDMAEAISKMADTMVPDVSSGVEYWAHITGDIRSRYINSFYSGNDTIYGQNFITGIKGTGSSIDTLEICNCSEMKEIDLKDAKIVGGLIIDLWSCPKLSKVSFPTNASNSNAVSVNGIKSCPNLKTLTLPAGTYIQAPDKLSGSNIEKLYYEGKPYDGYFYHWIMPAQYGNAPVSIFCEMEHLTDLYVSWGQGEVLDENGNDVLETCPGLQEHGVTVHYNWR